MPFGADRNYFFIVAPPSENCTSDEKNAVQAAVMASMSESAQVSHAECMASWAMPMSQVRMSVAAAAISPIVEPQGRSDCE